MPQFTHAIPAFSFFVAKVQTLLSAILTGVVGTAGSIFLEAPCSRAIFYAPLTVLFTGAKFWPCLAIG